MTPEEALQILDNLAANAQANRNNHAKLQQAIAVLSQTIAIDEAARKAKDAAHDTDKKSKPKGEPATE